MSTVIDLCYFLVSSFVLSLYVNSNHIRVRKMAAANIVRSALSGLLRKSTTYRTPVVCRLSTVALQQKYNTVNVAIKTYKTQNLQNGVSTLSVNTVRIFPINCV